mmetsp:Transcript_18142/g.28179  ORF Transcript_18142/g.28179 Transcript_18142/m.28179 type:complete len:381 (+) Transcript_18142:1230-2372(+)
MKSCACASRAWRMRKLRLWRYNTKAHRKTLLQPSISWPIACMRLFEWGACRAQVCRGAGAMVGRSVSELAVFGKPLGNSRFEMIPNRRGALGNFPANAILKLVTRDVVFRPSATIGFKITNHWLYAVNTFGKDGVIAFCGFKLVPQGAQLTGLICWKKAKYTVCRGTFGRFYGCDVVIAMDWAVANINLHQIMDQQHADHAIHIDVHFGVFRQDKCVERDVPAVTAAVFFAVSVEHIGCTIDGFQLIGFSEEGDLRGEAVAHSLVSADFMARASLTLVIKKARPFSSDMRIRTSVRNASSSDWDDAPRTALTSINRRSSPSSFWALIVSSASLEASVSSVLISDYFRSSGVSHNRRRYQSSDPCIRRSQRSVQTLRFPYA